MLHIYPCSRQGESRTDLWKEVTTMPTKKSLHIFSSALFLFLFILQLQNPGQSVSGEETCATGNTVNSISYHSSGRPIIGQLRTKDKVLIIRSAADGQIYTVKSKEGDTIAVDLNALELDAKFPELKEVVKKGLAGDASLRSNDRIIYNAPTPVQVIDIQENINK